MKIYFEYSKEKDIWCILNKGKSSQNSPYPTKVYEELVKNCGENPSSQDVSSFIDLYTSVNKINISEQLTNYEKDWNLVEDEYKKRAESIFGVTLPKDIIAYLTVNNRCPYHIRDNYFFVSTNNQFSGRRTVMHELWHFYTWYGIGTDEEKRLGLQKYNDLKEALTVLLNIECKDLLPEGFVDMGYPQHKEIREKIVQYWAQDKNIKNLWRFLVETSV
jgi:hypothetical protein